MPINVRSLCLRDHHANQDRIYSPPKEGLPYLIVTSTSDDLKVLTANSSVEARAWFPSERYDADESERVRN